ncbi:MAG: hypothetical protein LBP52_05880 [Burkholderiaceae bacterium]|jgi:hypothetical protein|nr:hypothetical protein [Burkholderiaceae bacterium]
MLELRFDSHHRARRGGAPVAAALLLLPQTRRATAVGWCWLTTIVAAFARTFFHDARFGANASRRQRARHKKPLAAQQAGTQWATFAAG